MYALLLKDLTGSDFFPIPVSGSNVFFLYSDAGSFSLSVHFSEQLLPLSLPSDCGLESLRRILRLFDIRRLKSQVSQSDDERR